MDDKKSNIKAIRKDVIIETSMPQPNAEVVAEAEWILEQAKLGNIRELVYAASDLTNVPIFGIYGDPVNYPMMQTTIKTLGYMYFHGTTFPAMIGIDLGDIDE